MSPKCSPPQPPIRPGLDTDEEIAMLAKALGHPARVKILRFLRDRDECLVGRIVEVLPLAQATVSRYLEVLREGGDRSA